MKITFVLPHAGLAGGIRVIATYAELLYQRGHDVFVVSTSLRPSSLKKKIIGYIIEGWRKSSDRSSHFDGLAVPHKVIDHFRPINGNDVPDSDLVIATWWETAEWVATFPSSKGEKVYFIQGYDAQENQPVQRVIATYKLPFKKITVSAWLRDKVTSLCGDTNITIIPNSVDHNFFDGSLNRKKQKIPAIGFVYSPMYCKGSDIISSAIALVLKSHPNLKILSFGSTYPRKNYPLSKKFHFFYCPTQQEIREIYGSCDFWIFGSREEGFGLPILEAMACRTPVIATMAGAAPELLSQGGGRLVLMNNPQNLADAILECLSMPGETWKELSQQARKTATRYSWDAATRFFEQILQDVLQQAGAGAKTG